MKILSPINDYEDVVTKTYSDNSQVLIIPEKVYYTGETKATILNLRDIITTYTQGYIDSNGKIVSSSSNYVKKFDLSEYIPTQITVQSRNTSWYSIAFYSSTDTFDSTTFISGMKASSAQTNTTFTISSIPLGALTMLAVRYSSQIWEASGYSASDKDYLYSTVSDAVTQWKTDSYPQAVVHKKADVPSKIYRVGKDRTPSTTEFTTLIDAVLQWNTDGKPTATIYVDSGEYVTIDDPTGTAENPLQIVGGENRLTIIGEGRESTIIKATTGKYIHPAIDIQAGNVTLKNMTFIADHSDNENFTYYDADRGSSQNAAYAVHCDSGTVAGVVEIENCNLWSWQSCGLGCGTIKNSHIVVKNCDIRSFANGTNTSVGDLNGTDEEKEQRARYIIGSRGAIVYHPNVAATGESNESFTLIDSRVYMKGGYNTVQFLYNGVSSTGVKLITCINNTFWNGFAERNKASVVTGFSLSQISRGNNLANLNKPNSDYAILIE